MYLRLTCDFASLRTLHRRAEGTEVRPVTWASMRIDRAQDLLEFYAGIHEPPAPDSGRFVPVQVHDLDDSSPFDHQFRLFEQSTTSPPPMLLVEFHPTITPTAWWAPNADEVHRVDELCWVGGGMKRKVGRRDRLDFELGPESRARRSRTIGAFEGDFAALARLQKSRYAIVGCGRNGALLAGHLAALGVTGTIYLVDDDLVEDHNADAMGLDPRTWTGERKVDAVAKLIRRQFPGAQVETCFESATHPAAIQAMMDAHVLLCAVDHGEARLIAATVASSCLKPMLDVGSAITREDGQRIAGCDVRLVLPGRCLLCWGGVDDPVLPRDILWFRQREGSLRSLNSVGTGLAQYLLERLFIDEEMPNTWMQVRLGSAGIETHQGRVSVLEPREGAAADCPVCRRVGWGPAVLGLGTGTGGRRAER